MRHAFQLSNEINLYYNRLLKAVQLGYAFLFSTR